MRKVAPEIQRARRQAYMRNYYKTHREKWVESSRRRRQDPAFRIKQGQWNKKWMLTHADQMRVAARRYKLLKTFGLSFEQYDEMLAKQGGGCAICAAVIGARGLSVDHDHDTGQIRGLLCNSCNVAISRLGDSPTRMRAAANYIEMAVARAGAA